MTDQTKRLDELSPVSDYLSACPYAEFTQIDAVDDDGDVFVLTVGMAIVKDDLTKTQDKEMPLEESYYELLRREHVSDCDYGAGEAFSFEHNGNRWAFSVYPHTMRVSLLMEDEGFEDTTSEKNKREVVTQDEKAIILCEHFKDGYFQYETELSNGFDPDENFWFGFGFEHLGETKYFDLKFYQIDGKICCQCYRCHEVNGDMEPDTSEGWFVL
jgi:hypothetical protein